MQAVMWSRSRGIEVKTREQLTMMRAAGLVVAGTLRTVAAAVRPGVSTAELDAIAEEEIRAAGATPSFKGYHGYPATICTSVNNEIVHGIPRQDRRLREGDIISIDCGAIVDGWHGDAAVTVGVGAISAAHARLLEVCETALWHGLAQARAGGRLGDISHAVQESIKDAGSYGVVEEYTGHGIGTAMHMDPPVPNYGRAGRGPRLVPGMALAIEPMVMLGGPDTVLLDDDWTVLTADGSWAAHFEHTVAITADGPWVLTAEDGGKSGFERYSLGATTPAGPPGGSLEGTTPADPPHDSLGGTTPAGPPGGSLGGTTPAGPPGRLPRGDDPRRPPHGGTGPPGPPGRRY
jgi:methionyl aminopeptidase